MASNIVVWIGATYTIAKVRHQVLDLKIPGYNLCVKPREVFVSMLHKGLVEKPVIRGSPFFSFVEGGQAG